MIGVKVQMVNPIEIYIGDGRQEEKNKGRENIQREDDGVSMFEIKWEIKKDIKEREKKRLDRVKTENEGVEIKERAEEESGKQKSQRYRQIKIE